MSHQSTVSETAPLQRSKRIRGAGGVSRCYFLFVRVEVRVAHARRAQLVPPIHPSVHGSAQSHHAWCVGVPSKSRVAAIPTRAVLCCAVMAERPCEPPHHCLSSPVPPLFTLSVCTQRHMRAQVNAGATRTVASKHARAGKSELGVKKT